MVVQAVLVFTMVILFMFIMLLLKNKRVIQHYLGRSSSKCENFSALGGGRVFLCDHVEKWELFLTLLNDRKGFVISRESPSLVERKLGSKEVPVLWLTKVEGENCVYPTRLPYLHQVLVDFMREGDAPKVIMLDGFEYLVLENGFEPVFKFLASLRDYGSLNNTIILLPVFKNALDEREYALLSREFSRVHSTS